MLIFALVLGSMKILILPVINVLPLFYQLPDLSSKRVN